MLFAVLRLARRAARRGSAALGGVGGGRGAGGGRRSLPFLELLAHSGGPRRARGRASTPHTPLRFGLALALPDYWGRPTQLVSQPFIVTRAFYAGALPLLLAVGALLRPTRERVAIAARARSRWRRPRRASRCSSVANHAARASRTAHNTRLAIVTLLCVALLAGWGLDDLTARRGRAAAAAS